MTRMITDHLVDPLTEVLEVHATDKPGAGGANHRYVIRGYDPRTNVSHIPRAADQPYVEILFQNGPIPEMGVNGVTQEAVLAVVIDRLRSFQEGPYPCSENAEALDHAQKALAALKRRTTRRLSLNVEGKMEETKPTAVQSGQYRREDDQAPAKHRREQLPNKHKESLNLSLAAWYEQAHGKTLYREIQSLPIDDQLRAKVLAIVSEYHHYSLGSALIAPLVYPLEGKLVVHYIENGQQMTLILGN